MIVRCLLVITLLAFLPITLVAENGATVPAEGDPAGRTGPAAWNDLVLPAFQDFVLSLKVPPDWLHSYSLWYDIIAPGSTRTKLDPTWQLDIYLYDNEIKPPRSGQDLIKLSVRNFGPSVTLEEWVNSELSIIYGVEGGFDRRFGRHSWSLMCPFGDEWEERRTDISFVASATMLNGLGVQGQFKNPWYGKRRSYAELEELFNMVLKSIAVVPIADESTEPVERFYISPRVTVTPGKWGLDASFSMVLPPSWEAEEGEVRTAVSGGTGRLIVDFYPREPTADVSIIMHMDGRAFDDRLSAAEFMGTREPIVASMLTDAQEVETEADVWRPVAEEPSSYPYDFCLSSTTTQRFSRTEEIAVKSYVGKDANSGEDMKLRVYTAGGVTLACNLIIKAPSNQFEQVIEEVDTMIRSVQIQASGMIMWK